MIDAKQLLAVDGDMQSGLLKLASESLKKFKFQYVTGISFGADDSIVAWFNNQFIHSAALSLNFVHNAILKTFATTDHNIHVKNAPLKFLPTNDTVPEIALNVDTFGFGFTIVVGLSMTILSASYISFYIKV